MGNEQLVKHLAEGEGVSVEFKRCGSLPSSDFFETICSFANRQGGTVYLGVLDNGEIAGLDPKRIPEIKRNIANVVNNPKIFSSAPTFQAETIDHDGKAVLSVWVPFGPTVYRYKGKVYDRVDDVDVRLKTDSQISDMYLRKRELYTEQKVFRFLRLEDLRLDLLPRVRNMARSKRLNHPWLSLGDEELLADAGLYRRDLETGEEGYTLAAAVLLGKDEIIASALPAYKTDAVVRLEDEDRYDDRITLRSNLIESYDALMAFAQAHMPDRFHLEGGQNISIRDILARELIVNMLVHREFTSSFPATVTFTADGVKTENASRARFAGPLTPSGFKPMAKNPAVARFFAQIGLAEDLGSGTRALFKYSPLYSGAEPGLVDGDAFEAYVPIRSHVVGSCDDLDGFLVRLISDSGPLSAKAIVEASPSSERTTKRHLAALVEQGAIHATGSTRDRLYTP